MLKRTISNLTFFVKEGLSWRAMDEVSMISGVSAFLRASSIFFLIVHSFSLKKLTPSNSFLFFLVWKNFFISGKDNFSFCFINLIYLSYPLVKEIFIPNYIYSGVVNKKPRITGAENKGIGNQEF